ncbi:phosphomevalonate kinase [Cellulomonas hominis]
MIEVSAPGKLFIAGEYAVVEAGQPAVLVAVDRHVKVQLRRTEGVGRLMSDQYGHLPVVWRRQGTRLELDHDDRPFDYVLAAIRVVEELAVERGRELVFHDIAISSELDDHSGRKFGLGSSAAVTVATVRGLDRVYGLDLTVDEALRLALLATIEVNPRGSGGDIAASMLGGWICYYALDRDWVRAQRSHLSLTALLAADWPGLATRRLRPPTTFDLVVGWTGSPASTTQLVDTVQSRKRVDDQQYAAFLTDSRACVERLARAVDEDDAAAAKQELRRARRLLRGLGDAADLVIETPALIELCAGAERIGAAAKSSGAGGGDCGIVLADHGADLGPMLREWELADIRHLSLRVHDPEGALGG